MPPLKVMTAVPAPNSLVTRMLPRYCVRARRGIAGTVGTMLVCEKLFTPPVLVLSLRQLELLPAQLKVELGNELAEKRAGLRRPFVVEACRGLYGKNETEPNGLNVAEPV